MLMETEPFFILFYFLDDFFTGQEQNLAMIPDKTLGNMDTKKFWQLRGWGVWVNPLKRKICDKNLFSDNV